MRLYRASEEDVITIYENLNLWFVEKYFFDDNKQWIKYKNWYESIIASKESELFILKDKENNFIGQVKFLSTKDEITVDIFIIKKFRNMGYGGKLLKDSIKEFKSIHGDKLLIAYIFEENIESIKIFKNNGFKYLETTEIDEMEMLKYIL